MTKAVFLTLWKMLKFSFQKIRHSSRSRMYEVLYFCLWNSFSSPKSEVECIKYNIIDFCDRNYLFVAAGFLFANNRRLLFVVTTF